MRVLRFLAHQPRGEASLSAIAGELGLSPSTAYHLVATLAASGYLRQNPGNRWYQFGGESLWLATAILSQVDVLQEARAHMEEFCAQTDESITLVVPDEAWAMALHRVEPGGGGAFGNNTARRAPMYCTAAGKALTCELSEARVRELLAVTGMAPRTPRTLTSPESFLAELAWVRQHGLAIDNEEWTPGIRCVAVPIRNYAGAIVAALSTAAPVKRLDGEHLNRVIAQLQHAGRAVSGQLGFGANGSTHS